MASEFNEPWAVEVVEKWAHISPGLKDIFGVVDCEGESVIEAIGHDGDENAAVVSEEFARRIVACVNFCRGIPTEELLAGGIVETPLAAYQVQGPSDA